MENISEETILLPEAAVEESTELGKEYCLILYNDEVNSFDHVINVLIEVCRHDEQQAQQCAYIAHYKGECDVKIGAKMYLQELCKKMSDKGLTVAIEKL